jgi:hypothetical protein
MPGTGQSYKDKHFTDVQPNETYDKKGKNKSIVFTSLEEWAMLLLTPPVQHQLEQAINIDKETKERHKRCMKKINRGYEFEFSTKNYAKKNTTLKRPMK